VFSLGSGCRKHDCSRKQDSRQEDSRKQRVANVDRPCE